MKNHLTSLDVSQNTTLERLFCYDNPLEKFYLKNGYSIAEMSLSSRVEIIYGYILSCFILCL